MAKSQQSVTVDWARESWVAVVVALLLAGHIALGWDAARQLTVTHDEYWHVPVGLLNARTHRFHFDTLNPPLTRLVSAVPLLTMKAQSGPARFSKTVEDHGDAFVAANGPRFVPLLTAARVANLAWSVLGCVILVVWARELYGRGTAIAAAVLWITCPTLLAHGSLVTPDLGLTAMFVVCLYALWKAARNPTWPWVIAFGVCLGLALATKFTAVLLVPLAPVLWLVMRFRAAVPPLGIWPLVARWAALAVISLAVLNALHLFEGSFSPLAKYQFASKSLSRWNTAPAWVRAIPVPLPRAYVEGLDRQRFIMEHKHPAYLDGRWSENGFRDYFIRALAYKLPHGFQVLLLLSAWCALRQKNSERPWRLWIFLGIPALLLLVISSFSGMQLGVRYVLPVFPLLMLVALHGVAQIDFSVARWRSGLTILALLSEFAALRHHPQHLGYFNELAGGPIGGRAHLLDSNLDWGQNLRELRTYVAARRIRLDGLAYFGTARPADFGFPRYRPPPGFAPQPGTYAVSVNFVKSRPHFVRLPDGTKRGVNWGEYGYFDDFAPKATIGSSLDVYEITPGDVARWHSLNRQRR